MTPALQTIRFGAVGLLNTAIGLCAIYGCMLAFGLGPEASNFLGYAIGLSVSFFLNRSWTFQSSAKIGTSAPRYALVVALAYLVNLAIVSASARHGMNPWLAQICGVAPYAVLVFMGCRFYVFRNAIPRNA